MTTQFVEGQPPTRSGDDVRSLELGEGSAAIEALCAAAAIVLAILGLAGTLPAYMMAIGTIVLGAAILLQAGSVGLRFRRLVQGSATEPKAARAEVGGGMSAEMFGGLAAIVLGILALLGAASAVTLCAVALIAIGAGVLLGSAATARFRSIGLEQRGVSDSTRHTLDEAMRVSSGAELLVGIGAIVLGILALLGVRPETLVLVGLLAVAFTALVGASALGARMFGMLRDAHSH
jgi:hypothetical protein